MEYLAFCEALGLAPDEEIRAAYENAENLMQPLDLSWLDRLLPETGAEVRQVAKEVAADPIKQRYVNLLKICYWTLPENKVPLLPQGEGKSFENLAPVLVMISSAEQAEQEMERRGIPEEMRERIRVRYERTLLSQKRLKGYLVMPGMYFFWHKRSLIPNLYNIQDMEFELMKMKGAVTVYRENASGKFLGLREEQETDTAFVCTQLLRGGEPGETKVLSKAEYSRYLAVGEDVIGCHIPRGARIDPESLDAKFAEARAFFQKYYPERPPKCFYCGSWLLDPTLADHLSPQSNIVQFQRRFQCWCVKSTGKEVFVFVHPQPFESYEDLPENTSLERMLKKRYLAGDPIYVHSGICLF